MTSKQSIETKKDKTYWMNRFDIVQVQLFQKTGVFHGWWDDHSVQWTPVPWKKNKYPL